MMRTSHDTRLWPFTKKHLLSADREPGSAELLLCPLRSPGSLAGKAFNG